MDLKKKHGQRIINYVNEALVYYGIIDAGKMHELTCQALQLPLEKHDFDALMRDTSLDDDEDMVIDRHRKWVRSRV
jgi:hypothetical protein